jgi:tyrosine-protein kinase Etk/Wzc
VTSYGGGPELELRDYVDVLRRRKTLFVLTVIVVAVVALAGQLLLAPASRNRSTTTVVIESPGTEFSQGVGAIDRSTISMETEAVMATSRAVAEMVAEALPGSEPAARLMTNVSVEVVPDTQLLRISYEADSPDAARDGAAAFASAYLEFRADQAARLAQRRTKALTSEIERLQDRVEQTTRRIRGFDETAAERIPLEARRSTLVEQIAQLQNQAVEDRAQAVSVGSVLDPAGVATVVGSPGKRTRVVAVGALLVGVLIGLIVVFVVDRLDRRVATATDVARITGVPLLGQMVLGRRRRRDDLMLDDQLLRRLRAAVMAAVEQRGIRTLLFTAPSDTGGSGSLRLAASIAESGRTVALIVVGNRRDDVVDDLSAADMDDAQIVSDSNTLIPVQRHRPTGLDVVMLPRSLIDDPLMGPRALAETFRKLRSLYDMVIVEAPAALDSAEVFDCAAVAEGVIVIARLRTSRKADLATITSLLRGTGSEIVGVVIETAQPTTVPVTLPPDPGAGVRLPTQWTSEHISAMSNGSTVRDTGVRSH